MFQLSLQNAIKKEYEEILFEKYLRTGMGEILWLLLLSGKVLVFCCYLFEAFFMESNTNLISLIFLSYETFVFDMMRTNMPYPDKRTEH